MTINAGDTAWVLASAAMVMFMTPGLALFYGGMVRRKNLLSTIMMSFICLGFVTVLWMLYGYSLSFAPSVAGGFVGGLDFLGLAGVGQEPSSLYAGTIPHLAFMVFQCMFAVITVALFTGSVVERLKFSAMLLFSALWLTFIYSPVAHWVWGSGGWLASMGVLDFAGGAVVHINAGFSALALVFLIGRRKGFPGEVMPPNSIPLVVIGTGILWFGWFGFNAGSALGSSGLASNAFVTTHLSAAAAAVTWMGLSWWHHKPTILGAATGAVAGLVAITPAAGFVPPIAAIPIGIVVSCIGYFGMLFFKEKLGFDDSLDVFAVHGMGGVWGALATGIFASVAVNGAGADGLIYGNWGLVLKQMIGVIAVAAFAFTGTLALGKLVDTLIGLRVKPMEEVVGLDLSQHAERAYGSAVK